MKVIRFKGKDVGVLRDDGVFVGHRYERHVFRKFDGLGVSFDVLDVLRQFGCRSIVLLLHLDCGVKKYVASPEKFLREGVVWKDGVGDYQRVLGFGCFGQKKLV